VWKHEWIIENDKKKVKHGYQQKRTKNNREERKERKEPNEKLKNRTEWKEGKQ